ncbi:hypothetical protein QFC20_007603, partial [Naganishia adeliensis]
MPTARDGSLPRREISTKRQPITKPSTTNLNGENMPRKLTAFNEAQKMSAEADRSMGLTRSSSSRALQRRTSNVKESTRSQRFRLSDEDSSSDEDEEDDSQGARLVSQWFGPKRKGKEKAVVEVEDDEETGTTQIRVKAERRNSQSASTQRRGGGASMIPNESAVIDLTLQSTDDETPKSTTQRAKAKSTSTSKASGSQRSTTDGKPVVKKEKKTPPGRGEADKERLKRMISGGSGKSEGDSIVLLDTDEEGDITSKPVVSNPVIKPSPSQRELLSRKPLPKGSPAKATEPALATSHSQTIAQWRNTAPASSSARQLSQSNPSSSIVSHPTRSSQATKLLPLLFTTPSTSSPSKGHSPLRTSRTSDERNPKRMELMAPPIGASQGDVDMDHEDASAKQDKTTLRPTASPSGAKHRTPRGRRELLVEIPIWRSPRVPSAGVRSPLKAVLGSPLREGVIRTPVKAAGNLATTFTKTSTKSLAWTPIKTPTKSVHATPSRDSATPQSSILSSVSSRSRDGSRTPQQTPRIALDTDQFDSLARIVQDVPVTFSDGAAPEPVRQAAAELLTPTKASFSQSSRLLGKSASLVTPVSPRVVDAFLRSPSQLSATSSLPAKSHRDMLAIPSPSKRASMERLVPIRQHSQSVHMFRHIDFLASPAGKRKVPGSPVVEENAVDSPKRRHLSPPEQEASTTNSLRPRPRRARPVFASSPERAVPFVEMPLSPARSIRTDRGSSPNTPSKLGCFASHHMISTAQASPVQEYDTDRSYVSSSVMEEKLPYLIPNQKLRAIPTPVVDNKMDTTDPLDDDFKVGEDVDMAEVVDENVDLLDMFGDFDWTSDLPQATVSADHALSTTPISKFVEEAEE